MAFLGVFCLGKAQITHQVTEKTLQQSVAVNVETVVK